MIKSFLFCSLSEVLNQIEKYIVNLEITFTISF